MDNVGTHLLHVLVRFSKFLPMIPDDTNDKEGLHIAQLPDQYHNLIASPYS